MYVYPVGYIVDLQSSGGCQVTVQARLLLDLLPQPLDPDLFPSEAKRNKIYIYIYNDTFRGFPFQKIYHIFQPKKHIHLPLIDIPSWTEPSEESPWIFSILFSLKVSQLTETQFIRIQVHLHIIFPTLGLRGSQINLHGD